MTNLAEIPFGSLEAGMIFRHLNYGEQIILDLGRSNFGPVIQFHNCDIFSGKLPVIIDEETDIFASLAGTLYPSGAEDWEYIGMVTSEQISDHAWRRFEVTCPHCNGVHHFIGSDPSSYQRQCLACGMVHSRPPRSLVSFQGSDE